MMKKPSYTLATYERILKPLSSCIVLGTDVVCAHLLWSGIGRVPWFLWAICAISTGLLCAVNTFGLIGPGAAIGGIPMAVFSLAPAALVCVLAHPYGHAIWWATTIAFIISVTCMAFFITMFVRIRRAYAHAEPLASDCVLVVLGGYVQNGIPVRTVRKRLEIAAQLWHRNRDRIVLLTGGTTSADITEAEAMASWIETVHEVPHESILLECNALDTRENLVFSYDILQCKGLASRQICIVSSDYHLYRALRIASSLGIEATCVPAPTPLTSRLQQWSREAIVVAVFNDAHRA